MACPFEVNAWQVLLQLVECFWSYRAYTLFHSALVCLNIWTAGGQIQWLDQHVPHAEGAVVKSGKHAGHLEYFGHI